MKLIKIFLAILLIFCLLFVLIENTETVTINLIFAKFENIKVAVLILFSVVIGILIGYGLIVSSLLSAKSELRAIKRENKSILSELNDLRNAAIDSDIYDNENTE